MQVCDTKPKPHTVCEDGPMVEKRGGTYSKWEAVKMNNTFFLFGCGGQTPLLEKGSLTNESISERQRRRRLIWFELCRQARDILPANSVVPIRKARGSRVFFWLLRSTSILSLHLPLSPTEEFFSFFSFLQHCNYLTDKEEFQSFLFCHTFFMSQLDGVFGQKENLVQVKLFVQVPHKHMSIMTEAITEAQKMTDV